MARAVQLRRCRAAWSRIDLDADSSEVPPSRPLSVRVAGWALGTAAALIACGVVWIFIEGDSSEHLVSARPSDQRPAAVGAWSGQPRAKRAPPPSLFSRFWQDLWHGKPKPKTTTNQTLAALVSSCNITHWQLAQIADLKLEIRWGTGEIQQHRPVHIFLPVRRLGSVPVAPPAVSELWNVCTFADTHVDKLHLRCAKDKIFVEVGTGAASIAMAAR